MPSFSFCVQTFNTYGLKRRADFFEVNLTYRTRALQQNLVENDCEVVALQEVWSDTQTEILTELESSQPNNPRNVFISNPESGHNIGLTTISEMGNGQSQSYTFRESKPGAGGALRDIIGIGKGFSYTTGTIQNTEVTVINVHFMHMKFGEGQETFDEFENQALANAIQTIDEVVSNLPLKGPLVLTGDLNQSPDSLLHDLLRDVLGLRDAYTQLNGDYAARDCTYCGSTNSLITGDNKNFDLLLDYVYYRGGAGSQLTPRVAQRNLNQIQSQAQVCTPWPELSRPEGIWSLFTKPGDFDTYSDHVGVRVDFDITNNLPTGPLINLTDSEKISKAISTLELVRNRISGQAGERTLYSLNQLIRRLRVRAANDPLINFITSSN